MALMRGEKAQLVQEKDTQGLQTSKILKQISAMKSIIEEFKGREKENENYINKLKQKDEKID